MTKLNIPVKIENILEQVVSEIKKLEYVEKVVLYGSFAKGTFHKNSDLDIAVFVKEAAYCSLEHFRIISKICRTIEIDIQMQLFCIDELKLPCGIVEEITMMGIDIT